MKIKYVCISTSMYAIYWSDLVKKPGPIWTLYTGFKPRLLYKVWKQWKSVWPRLLYKYYPYNWFWTYTELWISIGYLISMLKSKNNFRQKCAKYNFKMKVTQKVIRRNLLTSSRSQVVQDRFPWCHQFKLLLKVKMFKFLK